MGAAEFGCRTGALVNSAGRLLVVFAVASSMCALVTPSSAQRAQAGLSSEVPGLGWNIAAESISKVYMVQQSSINGSGNFRNFNLLINFRQHDPSSENISSRIRYMNMYCDQPSLQFGAGTNFSLLGGGGFYISSFDDEPWMIIQTGTIEENLQRYICTQGLSAAGRSAQSSGPTSSSSATPLAATYSSASVLGNLVASDCRTRGWSPNTARWRRCEQGARPLHAASGSLDDPARVGRVISNHTAAEGRCSATGLRRGTGEFEACAVQARANIQAEASANRQAQRQAAIAQREATMSRQAQAEMQRATEMARAEAERALRRDQGLHRQP
jgi:hypothetical protein